MARNWNKIWRYLHLSLGLLLVVYHARIAYYHQGMFGVTTLWSEEIDEFVSIYFIFFVMWTGLAKWPIYPWYKKRQNRKKLSLIHISEPTRPREIAYAVFCL